ncbi:TlpA disulfide reductase family protein [Flavobacterium sp. H4147]|uniref:TlpA disulfide reductase family protein n=1 Tax=Flavobacterium sp. H4147 TaxID=3034149 RepID=UPI0023EC9096|nr:TlpA disulfide reductase family protein [Flavobacterium sp. H4147]
MKLKLSISLFFLSFIMVAQHNFMLNGICSKNANTKSIYLRYKINGKSITKSSRIHNNKFVFTGEIDFPTQAIICTHPKFYMTNLNSKIFYLEPCKMDVKLDFNDFNTIVVHNSKSNDEFDSLQNTMEKKKNHKKIDSIRELSRSYSDKMITISDNSLKNQIQKSLNSLDLQLDQLVDQNIKINKQSEFEFIKKNPNSFIAPDLLYHILMQEDEQISYDTIKNLYNKLSPEVKKSYGGKQLAEKLIYSKNSRIGSLAPDFKGRDVNDNLLQLSSFRNNKCVLLDFWASWCGPCREDFPFLKEIYFKYKDKGLEIISVSRDEKLDLWRNTIKTENVEKWKHFSIKENKSAIEDIYAVTGIPVKILIDKDGNIIGRWIGSSVEIKAEIESMISKVFQD